MIKQCLLASILIHVIILSIKIPKPLPKKKSKNKQPITVKIKQQEKLKEGKGQKEEDLYILKDILKQLEEIERLAKEEAAIKSIMKECKTHYRGIGITHSRGMWITKVVAGGPADKAGIKVGDIPLDSLDIRDRYPIGTQITVSILRDGIIHHIPVTIGKICTKSKNENKKP